MLTATDLHKSYDGAPALRGVSLTVAPGSIVAVLGPSGCGKSTLLRLIAGLESPDSGEIAYDGRSLASVPPYRRGFGLMFQEYALFPHLDVAANIAFGLRMQHATGAEVAARVATMLDLVDLEGYGARRVYELSGGERQRVALARSLAPRPALLMLDEPLGALDRALRDRLVGELASILRRVGVGAIYVTHDQDEAFAIADELVLMNAGRVEQRGSPAELYRRPASRFAARFLGFTNIIEGTARSRDPRGRLIAATPLGELLVDTPHEYAAGAPLTLVIRPEAAETGQGAATGYGVVHATVERALFLGSRVRLGVRHASGRALTFEIAGEAAPAAGAEVALALRPEAISVVEE
jgi:ABC-type Fe3+/spermidine/putrescine transport system ATPase subunit